MRRKSRSRSVNPPAFRGRNTAMDAQEALARRLGSSIQCSCDIDGWSFWKSYWFLMQQTNCLLDTHQVLPLYCVCINAILGHLSVQLGVTWRWGQGWSIRSLVSYGQAWSVWAPLPVGANMLIQQQKFTSLEKLARRSSYSDKLCNKPNYLWDHLSFSSTYMLSYDVLFWVKWSLFFFFPGWRERRNSRNRKRRSCWRNSSSNSRR